MITFVAPVTPAVAPMRAPPRIPNVSRIPSKNLRGCKKASGAIFPHFYSKNLKIFLKAPVECSKGRSLFRPDSLFLAINLANPPKFLFRSRAEV